MTFRHVVASNDAHLAAPLARPHPAAQGVQGQCPGHMALTQHTSLALTPGLHHSRYGRADGHLRGREGQLAVPPKHPWDDRGDRGGRWSTHNGSDQGVVGAGCTPLLNRPSVTTSARRARTRGHGHVGGPTPTDVRGAGATLPHVLDAFATICTTPIPWTAR
jgi:hypothetical protein